MIHQRPISYFEGLSRIFISLLSENVRMELTLIVDLNKTHAEIVSLKNFIDHNDIEGITKSEIQKGEHEPGTQGFDVLNSIKLIIEAAEKPLVELIDCLQKYVDGYHSKVTLKNSTGASLEIDMGRGIDKETLKVVVQMFLTQSK